ncbi:MAG: hypothetical protein NDF57_05180 [archaeon GBS-70-058]|nr:hypothetical protein [Candidatus Culexarchaeum nevadense]
MKQIAYSNVNQILNLAVADALYRDIKRIPLFRLEEVPEVYRNSDKVRFVVDSYDNIVGLVSDKFVLTQPREVLMNLIMPFANELQFWRIYYGSGDVIARFTWKTMVKWFDYHIKPGILVFDSVTKRFKLRICAAPYVTECGNELVFSNIKFAKKHLGLIKTELQQFIKKFKEWLFDLSYIKTEKDRMEKETIDKETFTSILNDLKLPEKYTKNIKWCNGYTLWQLYMDLTNSLTRLNAPIQYHLKAAKLLRI